MIIALFGGSGRTGVEFIPRALEAGHQLHVLARSPEKLPYADPALTITGGDVLNRDDVAKVIQGSEVVVSLLGQTSGGRKDVQTVGTGHMVSAMKTAGVGRIISMSGGGLPYEKDEPKVIDKVFRGVMGVFFRGVIKDAKDHAAVLRGSDLDWTIVRAPRLVDEPDQGNYKVGYVGTTGGNKISRGDVADFILKVTDEGSYKQDMPFVSW
ncbi:NAD(P)-dependent oxidoreductase [Neolewinella sp.]|uniref:NAD(P)-dependent oxidoreductase n=1 Tax=Neolewinella sp. TaxID=2993543 RepID=UPI003B52BC44